MKTTAIIFSKNRTLQLKSLLLSLRHFSDFDEKSIHVIYKADSGMDYCELEKSFACNFIRQGNFLEDLRSVVNSSDSDYIWFMVDDLIYRDRFSVTEIESFLDSNGDIDAFCLRLGKNVKKGAQPGFQERGAGILVWDTERGLGRYWNYFWELCSSIYRRGHVIEYLSKCRPEKETFPNPFEFHYYACMPNSRTEGLLSLFLKLRFPFRKSGSRIACYERSKCFIHGVNLVAELADDRKESFSPQELHLKMLDGYLIDFKSSDFPELDTPSPGDKFFKLVKE